MKRIPFVLVCLASVFFANAQNVGIGTSTPLQKLHVEGATFLNGNVGIGENAPAFPLSFPPVAGDKISLGSNTSNSFGFGIQSSLLQIHTDVTSADIAFGYGSSTSFTETMRVKGNGRVGIGTTTPQKNLSVQNGMNVDQADGNSGSLINAISFGNSSGEGIGSKRNAGSNQYGLDFYTGSQNRMSITNGGNVGIGTSTPGFPLNFASAVGDKISLYGNSGGHYGLGIQNLLMQIHSDAASSDIAFGYGSSAAFTENMRVKGNGNVGIGTTNPQKNLSVQNGMNIDQSDGNTGSVVNAITFGNNSGEGFGSKRNGGGNQWGLDFYTNSANRMSITNGGNVGIGTASPTAKLQVSGGDVSFALFGPNSSYGGQLYIGAALNQNVALTAQVLVSDGNLHIDPASGHNIYVGYYQARDIFLNPNGGKVGIGTASPATTLEVNGYSKLGGNAPAIKMLKLTGTTAATQGGFTLIPHGLDYSKILSVSVLVYTSGGVWIPPNYLTFPFSVYDWFCGLTAIRVDNIFNNSASILSAPIKILIIYEE